MILEIELQGAMKVKRSVRTRCLCLSCRLLCALCASGDRPRHRGRRPVESRLEVAKAKCPGGPYDYIIVNDTVEKTAEQLQASACGAD
ncbi:MAG: hypothetical protein ACLSAP_10300 [Oscillospiraceae bacterium]